MIKATVFGVGFNDSTHPTQKFESWYEGGKKRCKLLWICKYYRKWKDMLKRCYYQKTFKTYEDCYVCDEWLYFSKFKAWCIEQEDCFGIDISTMHLDKDLAVEGNKCYSKDLCLFVDSKINTFIIDSRAARGLYPLGVNINKSKTKYEAWCRYPFKRGQHYLGVYDTPEEAHEVWRSCKEAYAKLLVEYLLPVDERVVKILTNKYSKESWYK